MGFLWRFISGFDILSAKVNMFSGRCECGECGWGKKIIFNVKFFLTMGFLWRLISGLGILWAKVNVFSGRCEYGECVWGKKNNIQCKKNFWLWDLRIGYFSAKVNMFSGRCQCGECAWGKKIIFNVKFFLLWDFCRGLCQDWIFFQPK